MSSKLFIQLDVQLRFFFLEHFAVLNGLADSPPHQVVGKGVVVHMLLVLVRAHHVVNMQPAVLARLQAAGPELGAVQHQFVAVLIHEVLVAGTHVILPHPVGHVGGDMNFNEARPDLDELAGDNVSTHVLRGDLAVVQPGGLPGELGSLIAVVFGLGVSAG